MVHAAPHLMAVRLTLAVAIVATPLRARAHAAEGPSAETPEYSQESGELADNPDVAPDVNADDLDSLLDAADKDLSALSTVNIAGNSEATEVNPIVEGVSKKSETLEESPGIVDVITARDIQEFGAKNLYEVLQRATSVFMTGSYLFRQNVASIRGTLQEHEDNHVLVLINGRPFRDATLSGRNSTVYAAFPLQMIDHIEVIRGPGSVLYGTNAFNGVINIVTKDPDKPMMYAATLNGSHEWQSYSLGAGSGNATHGAAAGTTYSRQTGFPFTTTAEDPPGPPPAQTRTAPWGEDNVGAFAMYRRNGFTANVYAAEIDHEALSVFNAWPSMQVSDPRVFCDLGYALEIDEWQTVSVNFTYNYDGTQFIGGAGAPVNFRSNSYLAETTYRATLTENWDLVAGGLADFHEGISRSPGAQPGIPRFQEIWYGVYMQLEYQALDWLKLVGGMQANMPGEIPGGVVPRFGAIGSLSENWTAKFLYGQAFRSPYQLERSLVSPAVVGNPALTPEIIQTFDCQIAYHTDDFRLAATYFHSDLFGIITRTPGFPQSYRNGGNMSFDGVELENDWTLSRRWRALGSMTYQTNERDGVRNTSTAPNWMAKMGLAYNNDRGLNVGLFDSFFGDQTVPATAAIVNPDPVAYHLVSLNTTLDLDRFLHWHTGHAMRAQFLIENLFDEEINHAEFARERINSLPAGAGRTYYGGFTIDY